MPQNLLQTLTPAELDALDLGRLAERMDEVLLANRVERFGPEVWELLPEPMRRAMLPSAVSFIQTKTIQEFDEPRQRRLVHRFFASLLQFEFTMAAAGLMNSAVFTPTYDEATSFRSPRLRVTHAALEQYIIVSSRIFTENLLDLVYDLGNGKPLPSGSGSRLKTFRRWLTKGPPYTPYVYFAHVTLSTYRFDRRHRSPEIHGGSRYPKRLLRMEQEVHGVNDIFELVNQMSGVWGALFNILNGTIPGQFTGAASREWMNAYQTNDEEVLRDLLEEIFAEVHEGAV